MKIGRSRRDAEDLGRLRDRQIGEITKLHQLGNRRVEPGEFFQGLVQGDQVIVRHGHGNRRRNRAREDSKSPPCFCRDFRRAFSTRIRRMASAAAEKKWPRPSQGLLESDPTIRR